MLSDSNDGSPLSTPELTRRVLRRCRSLAAFSEEPGKLTRTFLCPPMQDVHAALSSWMEGAGMDVGIDGVGNLIGHCAGQTHNAPILLFGSHLDTVPNAGSYDGVLGVLLALAAVESLDGRRLPFAIDVIGFSEEEGVRFGVPYLGSLAVTGGLTPGLLARRDGGGVSVADAIRGYGLDPDDIPQACYDPQRLIGYVEAHIEQGPVLESLGLPLGVVEAIAGQTRARVTFEGRAGHAGTTPMEGRRDALAAAAEFVLAAERRARAAPGLVATVGQVAVSPGASNVIAGQAILSLDVRHSQDAAREMAVAGLRAEAQDIAHRRGLIGGWALTAEQPAVPMDRNLSDRLAQALTATGVSVHRLVSGAGHDAAILAPFTPTAMLFLRSPGGLSHHPDEAILPEDVEAALYALSELLRLMEQAYAQSLYSPRSGVSLCADRPFRAGE